MFCTHFKYILYIMPIDSDIRCTKHVNNTDGRCKSKKTNINGVIQPFCKRHYNIFNNYVIDLLTNDLANISVDLIMAFNIESPSESSISHFEMLPAIHLNSVAFECPICLEQKSHLSSIVLPCKHTFCSLCFIIVSNRTCPLCRMHF